MRILAIDPGTHRAGYAVLDPSARRLHDCGTLRIRGRGLPEKLLCLHRALERLIRRHRPQQMAVERPFVGKSRAGALTLGAARAICLLAAATAGARVFEYAPTEVKRAVSINGLARKGDVQRAVQLLLGLSKPPAPDASDAVALALCHIHRTI